MNFMEFADYFEKCAAEFDEENQEEKKPLEASADKQSEKQLNDSRAISLKEENEAIKKNMSETGKQIGNIKQLYDSVSQKADQAKEVVIQSAQEKNELLGQIDTVRQQLTQFLMEESMKQEGQAFDPSQIPGAMDQQLNHPAQLQQQKMLEEQQLQQQMAQAQQQQQEAQMMQQQMQQQIMDGGQGQPMPQDQMVGQPMEQDQQAQQAQAQMGKMSSDRYYRGLRLVRELLRS